MMSDIKIDKLRFKDRQGRERIFNGLNLVCKDTSLNNVYSLSFAQYQRLYQSGINILRFGIVWAAAEPSPGVYDRQYLQKVKEQLELAYRAGLYFFLDFHQDLYGVSFGGGAPEWAEITDRMPHITGDLWSDAYLISPALNRAVEHFWNNDTVCGMGLQDHFIRMVWYVAQYFDQTPGLLGYDLWNEPYPGSVGQTALEAAMNRLPGASGDRLENDDEKKNLIAGLTDIDFYSQLTRILSQYTMPFEKSFLMSFYEKVAKTIHEISPEAFLFTEPCYFTNLGAPSGIGRLSVPGQVFAPHGYDLIVDTGHDDLYNPDRVDLIFRRHKQTGDLLEVPTFIGEWGAFEGRPGNEKAAMQMIRILEKNLWSHTYWSWAPGMESRQEWNYLVRAYPVATAGTLHSYRWERNAFTLSYDGVPGITEVFVPGLSQDNWKIRVLQGDVKWKEQVWNDTGHGILSLTSDSVQRIQLCLEFEGRVG